MHLLYQEQKISLFQDDSVEPNEWIITIFVTMERVFRYCWSGAVVSTIAEQFNVDMMGGAACAYVFDERRWHFTVNLNIARRFYNELISKLRYVFEACRWQVDEAYGNYTLNFKHHNPYYAGDRALKGCVRRGAIGNSKQFVEVQTCHWGWSFSCSTFKTVQIMTKLTILAVGSYQYLRLKGKN